MSSSEMIFSSRRALLILSLAIVSVSLASAQDPETRRQPIPEEIEGTVENILTQYRTGQESVVLRSHAVGQFRSYSNTSNEVGICTGTWIGETTFITAAHCGDIRDPATYKVRMQLRPKMSLKEEDKERLVYECEKALATSFFASNSDLAVYQCGTERDPHPGDLHGFVDYSLPGHNEVHDEVYSVWQNPVGSHSEWGRVKLYSEGQITRTDICSWTAPNCRTQSDSECNSKGRLPSGHRTDVYGADGGSGSLQLSRRTHTAVIGPTTVSSESGGRGRNASSVAQILGANFLPPGERYWVETNVAPSDSKPSTTNDYGCAPVRDLHEREVSDADGDRVLDVQEEAEDEITQRDIYTLDFNTGWRRVLWETADAFEKWKRPGNYDKGEPWQYHAHLSAMNPVDPPVDGIVGDTLMSDTLNAPGAEAPPDTGNGNLNLNPALRTRALEHEDLNVKAGTKYTVRIEYATREGGDLPGVYTAFGTENNTCDVASAEPATESGSILDYHVTTTSLTSCDAGDSQFRLGILGSGTIHIRKVVIAENDVTWTFENWDEREPWTVNGRGHALIYENGHGSGEYFAAQVVREEDGVERNVTLSSAPLRPEAKYEVSFRAKKSSRLAPPSGNAEKLYFEIESEAGSDRCTRGVDVTDTWKEHRVECSTQDARDYVARFYLQKKGHITIDDVQFKSFPSRKIQANETNVGSVDSDENVEAHKFRVGDDDQNREHIALVSFDMPRDNTEVERVRLRLWKGNVTGTPLSTLGNLTVQHVSYGDDLAYRGGIEFKRTRISVEDATVRSGQSTFQIDITDAFREALEENEDVLQLALMFSDRSDLDNAEDMFELGEARPGTLLIPELSVEYK